MTNKRGIPYWIIGAAIAMSIMSVINAKREKREREMDEQLVNNVTDRLIDELNADLTRVDF